MLDSEGISYAFKPLYDGYQICYPNNAERQCSVIEHYISYGNEDDLLEIMGLLTPEEEKYDRVKGYLTAEEVFKRIKEHYAKMSREKK